MASSDGIYHYRYMSEPIDDILTERNTTPTSLNRPHDIKAFGDGYIIADKQNNRVVATDSSYTITSTLPKPAKDYFEPYGIAIFGKDIFVTDNNTGRVLLYKDGAVRLEFGERYLQRPTGIAVLERMAYVVDCQQSIVQVFNMAGSLAGSLVKTISKPGSGPNDLDHPWFVTFNSRGLLLVTDTRNKRIQVFEPQNSSSSVRRIPVKVGDKSMMPRGIAVDANDTIFVTAMERVDGYSACLQCVVVYSQEGIALGSFGESAGLYWPRGLTVIRKPNKKALITNDHSIKEVKL